MKKFYSLLLMLLTFIHVQAQDLPHRMTDQERSLLPQYNAERNGQPAIPLFTTPPASPVRTIGEWEELQGLQITWTSYQRNCAKCQTGNHGIYCNLQPNYRYQLSKSTTGS
jgi:hypothetical protein